MIPKNITKNDILKAIDYMDKNPKEIRKFASRKYDVLFNKKRYPPKRVISIANKFRNNEELSPEQFGGGYESNTFLESLGFTIKSKSDVEPIPPNNNVLYIIMTHEENTRDEITVKLGRTGNILRRILTFETTAPNLKLLRIWKASIDINKNERGFKKLAMLYTLKHNGEVFVFTSKTLINFIKHVDLFLKEVEPPKSVEKYIMDIKELMRKH